MQKMHVAGCKNVIHWFKEAWGEASPSPFLNLGQPRAGLFFCGSHSFAALAIAALIMKMPGPCGPGMFGFPPHDPLTRYEDANLS